MNKKQQLKTLLNGQSEGCFNLSAIENDSVDLMLYGIVGDPDEDDDEDAPSVQDIVTAIKGVTASTINVHLNTLGGNVWDGTAIYNALKAHPATVISHVDGIAASIGSIIAMAGDEIQMAKNAYLMIHNPMSLVYGDASDLRKKAEMLDKVLANLAQTYADRTGRPVADMVAMMGEETWFTAQEAKDAGFIDTISGESAQVIPATAILNVFNKVPEQLRIAAVAQLKKKPSGPNGRTTSRDAAAVAASKGGPVTLDEFKAFAVANPDAVAGYIEQGKKSSEPQAKSAGQQSERDRAKAIVEACADNHALALEAIVEGLDPAAVKVAAKAAAEARTQAKAEATAAATALATANAEIARLKEQVAFNTGTQDGVQMRGVASAANVGNDVTTVETNAKADWAANKDNCRASFKDEDTFVRVVKREAGVK